jgi:hypothetical protein
MTRILIYSYTRIVQYSYIFLYEYCCHQFQMIRVFLQGFLFILFDMSDNGASGSLTCIVVWKNIKLYNIFINIFKIPCKIYCNILNHRLSSYTTQAGTNHKIILIFFFYTKVLIFITFFYQKYIFIVILFSNLPVKIINLILLIEKINNLAFM